TVNWVWIPKSTVPSCPIIINMYVSWLNRRVKAVLTDGRELQASKISFQKEDLKAGYVTFEPYVGKPAYVCFDEDVASIANIECDWD
ncbi:TPA: hypothetical protein ACGVAN_004932, partial [Vibrio vulnificus]